MNAPTSIPTPIASSEKSRQSLDSIAADFIRSMSFGPGARVLEVSLGSGAGALAAAEAVGPYGCVLAVNCDERPLAATRSDAVRQGLGNVSFCAGGVNDVDDQPETFDVVVCSFPNFAAPEVLVRQLWHWVRVDGELVFTTFEGVLEPAHTAFSEALRRVRPSGEPTVWGEHVRHKTGIEKLLSVAAAPPSGVCVHTRELSFAAVEDWWAAVVYPYYRSVLSDLTPRQVEDVKEQTLKLIGQGHWRRASVKAISATVWKRRSSAGAS